MSNLNNNTTQLETLLAKVNALPEAGGTDTSDATATADEIFKDKTAYTADGKVTGTFTIEEELTEQNDLISQIQTALEGKVSGGSGSESVETCILTFTGSSFPNGGIMSFCYYDEENGYWDIASNYFNINASKNQYILRKNSVIHGSAGDSLWSFAPANNIERIGTYELRIIDNVTVTYNQA